MNDKWTDFEKWMFREVGEIKKELFTLKGRAGAWGAMAGLIGAGLMELVSKLFHT